jgi:CheY-like chemotaxis protein
MNTSKSLVFYADDDEDDRDFVAEGFQLHDDYIELKMFTDGIELLSYIDLHPQPHPCLIILDLNMPKIDGKDTLRMLRQKRGYENVPVVVFTTSSLPADSYFAQHYKAGFITKPLDLRQMTSIVERFLEYCSDEDKVKFKKSI